MKSFLEKFCSFDNKTEMHWYLFFVEQTFKKFSLPVTPVSVLTGIGSNTKQPELQV